MKKGPTTEVVLYWDFSSTKIINHILKSLIEIIYKSNNYKSFNVLYNILLLFLLLLDTNIRYIPYTK